MKPLGSSLWHCQPSLSCWPEQFLAVVSLVYSYHKLHQVPFLPHHAARNIPWVCATVYKKFNCFLCFTAYWYCYSRECFGDGSIIIFTPRSFLRLQAISRQNVNTSVRSPGDYRKLFPHGLHSSKNSSVKMAGYWPRFLFTFLWTSTSSRSIKTQKENSANIQPS